MVLFIVIYVIMIAVTFFTTFIGCAGLADYIRADKRMLTSVISAVFWMIGFPISIGMIAIAFVINQLDYDD